MKRITYFTPTYNRAYLLPNLYATLCKQTNKDFVWLIVDDGSKDNTEEIVQKWVEEKNLEITYIKKENGGKHTAIDLSNEVCETEYIMCVDSDDYISDDCTDVLLKYFDEVSGDENLCGIVSRRAHYDGKPFNDSWPKEAEKLYFKDLASKYNYTQDTNLVFKTKVIKQFKFPKFEDERFVTESVFYNKFILDYKMLAIPECVYLAEYQEDGYTAQGMKLFYKNPKGYLYALKQNAALAKRVGDGFKQKLYKAAVFYAWKKQVGLKETYKKDYKIKFPYNIGGFICSRTILRNKYKGEN